MWTRKDSIVRWTYFNKKGAIGVLIIIIIILNLGCIQGGLTLKDERPIELQAGEKKEFIFTVENLDGFVKKNYRDFTVEFIDDKWLVSTVVTEINKPVLENGETAIIKVVLEGAKVGINNDARLRLTYSDGGKEFRIPLTVTKDPDSNLTFKLSSLSPMELLAFNTRCGGGSTANTLPVLNRS
jgi:hypothetical protein